MNIYRYVCVCIYVCARVLVCICVCGVVFVFVCVCVRIFTCGWLFMYEGVSKIPSSFFLSFSIYLCLFVYMYMCVCVCVCVWCVSACLCACVCVYLCICVCTCEFAVLPLCFPLDIYILINIYWQVSGAAAGIGLQVNAHRVSSTEGDIDTRLANAWTAIDRLTDKMKCSFFQPAVVSRLLYGCPTWTLTKRMEKKLDGNYRRMIRAILNKSWRQHPTKSNCTATYLPHGNYQN